MTEARRPPAHVEAAAAIVDAWLSAGEANVLTAEQIAKLSPADRLDYARRFDQSKMPAWKDPRA
jgi:hypothetical protein